MKTPTRPRRGTAALLAVAAALVVAASVGAAGAQATDPIVFTVSPPSQTTTTGTQVDLTFTVSDAPPCADGSLTSLDSLDFAVSDPSGLSTIASFTTSEPPGTVNAVFAPDMRSLAILFDSAMPCENAPGAPPAVTETITVVVTIDVPAGVPPGTQLSLHGDARGFAQDPQTSGDYQIRRSGTVLVTAPPPPVVFTLTPPTQTTEPGSQVQATFTIADTPPCGADEVTTLDSLDVELSDPGNLSTIDSFTVSEPPGTVASNISPDGRALTIDVPAGVPSGAQLTIEGDARGFAGGDYLLTRTGLVLVEEAPPPPPPPSTDPGGNGGAPAGDGPGSTPTGATGGVGAPAAAAVAATPRFAG
jgi:hypothetical protein